MTTGRGFITDAEIDEFRDALEQAIMEETVWNGPDGIMLTPHMVRAGIWRAIRAGALDDILYERGVDFDEYDD